MEQQGEKRGDKETHAAGQNGGGSDEEFDEERGPDEETTSGLLAAKASKRPTRLNFHIPRKNREKRDLFQNVSTDSREFADIVQILTSSFKDPLSMGTFVYSKPRLVHNETLEKHFMEKRKELKQDGRTEKELAENYCFLLCDAPKISSLCERGLFVGRSWMNLLGNPSKGVYLCQFSDLLQIPTMEPGSTGEIIIFKVIKGKVKCVHDNMPKGMDPTPKFDSHFSKNSKQVTSLQSYKSFEYTQQYFYEYVGFEISPRPRHVCPYAVVSYQFKGKESSTIPKQLPLFRSNSLPSETTKGRRSFIVWRGHFINGGKDVYQASLRSHYQPFLPYKLPEKIEIGKVMRLEQVLKKIPSTLFSWKLYTGSHEVYKSGMYSSMFEVMEKDKSPKSLTALLQKLEENGLVLVNMVNNKGFLFFLSASQLTNLNDRRGSWKTSSIQALFIYREKRDLLSASANSSELCEPQSSEISDLILPKHDLFIPALHNALEKVRSDHPVDPGATVEQHVYDYLKKDCSFSQKRARIVYNPKLDIREKLFPAPREKTNWEGFVRPYIYNPKVYALVLERVKKKVEELRVLTQQSTEKNDAHDDPEKVKELLKLIQLKRHSKDKIAAGETGSPVSAEETCSMKRKIESESREGSAKRPKSKLDEEISEGEGLCGSSLSDVLSSVGLQDTDLRKDKTQGALKIMEVLGSLGKKSLDTDLRKEKAQGALEVIKLIDNLTRGAVESPKIREVEGADVSDASLFDSMLRLGLPTDRDIDLRKPFAGEEPDRTDCLEETSGSLSSLEAFSPCSDSGGQQRGVNLLGEKTIPWVLIPITGLKTERYSQRQMDYPEDPRFLQSPTVSTHTSVEDMKELSPPYQPDSSNIVAEADVQTAEEIENESSAAEMFTEDTEPPPNVVDNIVDELISGFSNEVEGLLRDKRIYYVSCSSTQGPQESAEIPVPPLSNYISNFNTPFPVNNYISSFHDSLMLFIDSQNIKRQHVALDDVSSSSAPEVLPNSCVSSSSAPKTRHGSESLESSSTASAMPALTTQRHQPSPAQPDLCRPFQKMTKLDPGESEDMEEAYSPRDDAKDENPDQTEIPAVKSEVISSIIEQLQPEVISNLVEIIKGVQKNTIYFYIHSPIDEESDVCLEIKEYLKKLGNLECNPHSFLEKNIGPDKLLVIIQNMDIAAQVHKIPALVSLKKHKSVSFAGVDNYSDIQNHTYSELFQMGGFIVSDEYVLNPNIITAEKLENILQYIEQLNSVHNPWRWRIHFKSHKKLRELSRINSDALSLYEILSAYEKRHIVEILPYHNCDAPSQRSPDLQCLVDLQARFIKQRHLIFLTGCRFDMFPHYSSSGIMIAHLDDIKFIISSLSGDVSERAERNPSAEIYSTSAASTSLKDDKTSTDISEDSTRANVPPDEQIHVDDSHPCVSESSLQDQPLSTSATEKQNELDFKALSKAISQFKASRMQEKSDTDETSQCSFRVDPHQSFVGCGDLTDFNGASVGDCAQPSSVLDFAADPTSSTSVYKNTEVASTPTTPVEDNNEIHEETACTSTVESENISNKSYQFQSWESSSSITQTTDTQSGTTNNATKSESNVTAQDNATSSEPPDKHGGDGLLPTPSNSGYGVDRLNAMGRVALQQSSFVPAQQRSLVVNCPQFLCHNGAIRHPFLNANIPNALGVVAPPVLRGLLPNHNMQMAWNIARGTASVFWGAQRGVDLQQIQQRAQFIQTLQGNSRFGNGYRTNRGGFNGW